MSSARTLRVLAAAGLLALAGCASAPAQKARPAKAPATKTQPAKPAAKPTAKPAARPATKPATKPAAAALDPVGAARALSPKARYARALEMLKSNQLQDAEAVLKLSAADYPREAGPHVNLGILYARSNRKAEARAAFARAIALNPRNAVAQNWAGVLAREAGDAARAEAAYRAAVAADPRYAPAWLNLGLLYEQHLKRPGEALAAWRRYAALTDPPDLRVLAWIAELEANGVTAPAAPAAAPVRTGVPRP